MKAKTPSSDAADDLKSLPLPETEDEQRGQTGVNRAGTGADGHHANAPK